MASIATAHLTIGRILDFARHVSGLDMGDSSEPLENRFDTPKTSAAENCCLFFCHGG